VCRAAFRDEMLRVKAFAGDLASGDDDGTLGCCSPRWGRHVGAPSLLHGVLWVKILSSYLDE
jgi:hypothetical protein